MIKFLSELNLVGGAKIAKKSGSFPWLAFFASLVLLLIKAFLAQWAYNYVMPKVFVSMGGNPQAFRELSLTDALVLVILIGALF